MGTSLFERAQATTRWSRRVRKTRTPGAAIDYLFLSHADKGPEWLLKPLVREVVPPAGFELCDTWFRKPGM